MSRQTLHLAGCTITQVRVDWAVTLRLSGTQVGSELRIEQLFTCTDAEGHQRAMHPGTDPTGLGPILAAARTSVVTVSVDLGRLDLALADGTSLSVPPHDEYEAWSSPEPTASVSSRALAVKSPRGARSHRRPADPTSTGARYRSVGSTATPSAGRRTLILRNSARTTSGPHS